MDRSFGQPTFGEVTLARDAIGGRKTDLPRILVIDDEPLLGQTIRVGLRDVFEVDIETTAGGGLERLSSGESYDAVLCDLGLPDSSGAEVFSAVASRRPELLRRFVVMTGGAVGKDAQSFLATYSGRVLNKPFTLSKIEALVGELIQTS